MRIDEEAHGLLRDGGNCGLELVVHLRELTVYHDDAVVAGRNGRVAAKALEHVGPIAEIEGLHLDLRPVRSDRRRLLCESRRSKASYGGECNERDFFHDVSPWRQLATTMSFISTRQTAGNNGYSAAPCKYWGIRPA